MGKRDHGKVACPSSLLMGILWSAGYSILW